MIKINKLSEHDVDELVNSFAKHDWHKPRFIFEGYLKEQEEDKRQIWVARSKDLLGYVTLSSYSHYQPFFSRGIPEIMDLNVLPPFRNNGSLETYGSRRKKCKRYFKNSWHRCWTLRWLRPSPEALCKARLYSRWPRANL